MRLAKFAAVVAVVLFTLAALGSLFLGWIGATMDDQSTWSDPAPHRALVAAAIFGALAFIAFACWIAIPRNRSSR